MKDYEIMTQEECNDKNATMMKNQNYPLQLNLSWSICQVI